jgi:glycine cleavage system aminomethyltransferase T/glycine/D-amino acid oxidase-like deaminating enzyme
VGVADRARVVVIGGGITGASVAYHLAEAGWHDLILLDKAALTSGSTCHAAGLVTAFNPSPTMMAFRRYSIELYQQLGVFEAVGSVRIASSVASLAELRRGVSRARGIGLDAELISPAEVVSRLPLATDADLHGAVWMAQDGYLDPHQATHALVDAARRRGARIATDRRVVAIELDPRRRVRAVVTEQERIETELVVNAAGIWAPQVAALVGEFIASTPVDHQHIALRAIPGHELDRATPCFRDPDNLVYGKAEAGGVMFGGYEPDPVARWVDGVPWDHAAATLAPDEERFAVLMDGAVRRFPLLRGAGVVRLVCHPDAMTPDANPLMGPMPSLTGFWVAAGLSLNGFGGAGGIGRAIASWITSGEPQDDVTAYRAWRFGRVYRNPSYAASAARETYRYYYRQRYPLDTDEFGRPQRTSPLHVRSQDHGAVFGVKNGIERADYHQPGQRWRRAGADQHRYGFTRPPFLDRVAAEHHAVRERVGMFDLTSFGKIDVQGRGALRLLEAVCANRIDRPPGSIVYTQMLNRRGGIIADVTVTRLDQDWFRVITGAASLDADLGWLVMQHHAAVTLTDATDTLAVIGLFGADARAAAQAVTDADLSDAAFGLRTARAITLGGVAVWAQRISYSGDLGFEFYVPPASAVSVWDRLWHAAQPLGAAACGYRCLDSLRIEKGYRYLGTDLTANDTPDEAGLGRCVATGKSFIGSDAVEQARRSPLRRRLRTLIVGEDGAYQPVYGGEAVLAADGELAGRVRSAAYGFSAGAMLATAYLDPDAPVGAQLGVDLFGQRVPAVICSDVVGPASAGRVAS